MHTSYVLKSIPRPENGRGVYVASCRHDAGHEDPLIPRGDPHAGVAAGADRPGESTRGLAEAERLDEADRLVAQAGPWMPPRRRKRREIARPREVDDVPARARPD